MTTPSLYPPSNVSPMHNNPRDSQETLTQNEDDLNLNYELPPLISAFQQSWLTSFQNTAVVTSMLTAAAAQILAMIKSDDYLKDQGKGVFAFLNTTSYCAIMFNASATITALFLIDRLAEIHKYSSRKANEWRLRGGYMAERPVSQILGEYGAEADESRSWKLMVYHLSISLVCGILCIFLQLMTFVALREGTATIVVVSVVLFFVLFPFVVLVLRHPLAALGREPEGGEKTSKEEP